MTFPDFSNNKGFNALFNKIDAPPLSEELKLSHDTDLTGADFRKFKYKGLSVKMTEIKPYNDHTLTYHSYRVFVYLRSTTYSLLLAKFFFRKHYYHFSSCKLISKNNYTKNKNWMMFGGKQNLFSISKEVSLAHIHASFKNRHTQHPSGILIGYSPCPHCLRVLDWEKYQSSNRKQRNAISKSFSPSLFYSRYTSFIKE